MKKIYNILYIALISFLSLNSLIAQQSTEVGVTEGQLNVSLTGAATYTVPIKVLPGINGIQPNISLVYNSQARDGVAGYGWNIGGLSAITRIPATKFHDGFIDGVDLDQYDRFALDGQRLILKSGTYGGDGAVYETENYSNIKVVSYGTHPAGAQYGPASFKVFYPDGSIATYDSDGSSNKTSWVIKRKENATGLFIGYSYITYRGSSLISYIYYGNSNSSSNIFNISFQYNTLRIRHEKIYVGGQSIYSKNLLTKISIKKGYNNYYKNYYLYYNFTHLGYPRLIKITEKNGDNSKALNPIVFEYDDYNGNFSFQHSSSSFGLTNTNAENTGYISGDFNGDARMDMILYPKTGSSARKKLWIKLSDSYTGNGFQNFQEIILSQRFDEILPINWKNHQNKVMAGQGACVITNNASNNEVYFDIYRQAPPSAGGGMGLDYRKTIDNFPTVTVNSYCNEYCEPDGSEDVVPKKEYLSGDFDGDGMIDILAVDRYAIDVDCVDYDDEDYGWGCMPGDGYSFSKKVYLINLDRNNNSPLSEVGVLLNSLPPSRQFYKLIVGDYNGDGKSDLYVFTNHHLRVYSLDHNNHLYLLASVNDNDIDLSLAHYTSDDTEYSYYRPVLIGDYNGDGKMDFVIPEKHNSDNWHFYFAKGANDFEKQNRSIGKKYYAYRSRSYIPNDFNGDGKTDILIQTHIYLRPLWNNQTTFTLLENKEMNHVYGIKFHVRNIGDSHEIRERYPISVFLNINQNNYKYEYVLLDRDKIHYYKNSYDHNNEILLRKIKNHGVEESISYAPMVDGEDNDIGLPVYRSDYNHTYPYVDLKNIPSIKLVTKLRRTMYGYDTHQYFSYYNAVANMEGLGYQGFEKILKTNWYDDNHTPVSSVSSFDISKRGALSMSYTMQGINYSFSHYIPANYITKTENHYVSSLSANKVFKLQLDWSKSYDKLHNTSVKTAILHYDTYNNPTFQRKITYSDLNTTSILHVKDVVTYYEHNPGGGSSGNPYYIGRVKEKRATDGISNDNYVVRKLFTYNNQMLLTQTKKKAGQSDFITTDYTYDAYGNVLSKTITTPHSGSRTTSYTYDNTHRFISSATDIEGLVSHYTYDMMGNVLTETDGLGHTSQHEYDTWGKIIKDIDYLGNETTYTYHQGSDGSQLVWVYHPDDSKEFKLIDPLGREVRTATVSFRGHWDYIKKDYDIYNRVVKSYEPFDGWNGWQNALFTTYTYDIYGRPTGVDAPNGHTISYTYNGLTTTVNDNGKIKTTEKNALGQVIRTTDDGGTITYDYYANGKLKQSYFNQVYTKLYYDDWGRKTRIEDPSAGTYTYTYNDWGDITRENTPNGTMNFVYNNVGKLVQKMGSGMPLVVYSYDQTTKLLNNIQGLTFGSYTYTYDNYHRLKTVSETINGNIFKRELTYDNLGRVLTEKNTSRRGNDIAEVTIKNFYRNGVLYKIADNNTNQTLWELNEVNVRGQQTRSTFGNGLVEQNSYDQFGFLLNTATTQNSINVANIAYSFDTTKGLLMSRTNDFAGFTENFRYDNLDRLIEFTEKNGTQVVQQQQSYLSDGRIHDNKIGKYQYSNTTKPYQNTKIADLSLFGHQYYEQHNKQQVIYNAFKAPISIEEANGGKLSFRYNAFEKRSWKKTELSSGTSNKYYAYDGTMEIKVDAQGNIQHTIYIGGDAYSAPVIYRKDAQGSRYLYLHRDYLSSIIGISNQQGQMLEKRAFDAWGNLLSLEDANGNTLSEFAVLDRGYTGHEHLFSVGLIHMNARLYDPLLHRFLAPDNYIQNPYNTQNFNRYGYVLNNPLMYADPSGNNPLIFAALIGGLINWAVHGFDTSWSGLGYFMVGALSGALSAGIGMGVSSALAGGSFSAGFWATKTALTATSSFITGFQIGAASGFAAGFVTGLGNGLIQGDNFLDALGKGTEFGVIGGITGGLIGGTVSGFKAVADGRRFFDGATVTDTTIIDQGNPYVHQSSNANCVAASGESATNGRISQEQIRNDILPNSNIDTDGLGDGDVVRYLAQKEGRNYQYLGQNLNKDKLVSYMQKGKVFVNLNTNPRHEVLMNKIVNRQIIKLSGKIINKTLYYVMDPARGQYKLLYNNFLHSSNFYLLY